VVPGGEIVSTGVVNYQLYSGVTVYPTSSVDIQVSGGGIEFVLPDGVTSFTTISFGGQEVVFSGGSTVSTTVSGGGEETVLSGGTASFTTVSGNAVSGYNGFEVVSGGTAISTTVRSGGVDVVLAQGTASFTTLSSGGFEIVSSGTAISTTIDNGGTEVVFLTGIASDTVISGGGAIDVSFLAYSSGGSASVDSTTDVLTVSVGGDSYTQQLAGDYTGAAFSLAPDAFGDTVVIDRLTPCYASGTLILTDHGEVAVEDLHIGDRLVTLSGAARPVRWIGRRHLDLRRHTAPELVQPIRIRADAFADGMPRRDLLVSPDHAVLLDGGLIAARRLANDASIQRDVQCQDVTYYHVELETHDILLAEALPAESYLDTGNRGMFENADAPLMLHPDFDAGQQRRVAASCRPFVDDAASVEPIWRRLAMRAAMLGLALPAAIETTQDPGLHVVVGGRAITPVSAEAGRYTFILPTDGPVRLVSRAARPSEMQPWVEERRRLGVMVARLTLRRGATVAPIPLDHPHLSDGWWDVERDRTALWRWTDGNAAIPLSGNGSAGEALFSDGPMVLEITLAGSLDYKLSQEPALPAAQAAERAQARSAAA
jgi:autotransporter passenger strand-loop-strand repeat protein